MKIVRLAIFASGSGSNAQKIVEYFNRQEGGKEMIEGRAGTAIKVVLIVSNRRDALVIKRAQNLGVDYKIIEKEELNSVHSLTLLQEREIDYIILAGFLLKVPPPIIDKYHNRVLNIHPALLPKFGGEGMYGMRVHRAVIEAEESESGITIHLVDNHYDNGEILFQEKIKIEKGETVKSLAEKIHLLEWEHFPFQIAKYISEKEKNGNFLLK